MSEKHRNFKYKKFFFTVFYMLIGAVCGYFMTEYLDSIFFIDYTFSKQLFIIMILLAEMYAAHFLQIIIHEIGHLIFGLITGYRYLSLRIGSFIWTKENGKLKFNRFPIAGIKGQCLMAPPKFSENKTPFVLCNLGGPIMNAIFCLIFLSLYYIYNNIPYLTIFLQMSCVFGFSSVLINSIPIRYNDGYNTLSLKKSNQELQAYWIQSKIYEQSFNGIRLKDMPTEWFSIPLKNESKNRMATTIDILRCDRLMDSGSFKEAEQQMAQLLKTNSNVSNLERKFITCDHIYCELIGEKRLDLIESLLDDTQKKFMKSMRNFPTVLRTEYSYALLVENDLIKAQKIKAQFEKNALKCPHAWDIESEREFMNIAYSTATSEVLRS